MSNVATAPAPRPEEILRRITALAREKLGCAGPLAPDTRLVEDLELDSIRLLTLAVEVEDHFQICLDEEDEGAIVTVGDLAAMVSKKLVGRKLAGRKLAS